MSIVHLCKCRHWCHDGANNEVAAQQCTQVMRRCSESIAAVAVDSYFTMWLLSLSIFSNEISRSVVEGTPSSSICTTATLQSVLCQLTEKRCVLDEHLQARLLECNYSASCPVFCFVHFAIGALANLFYFFVVLHGLTLARYNYTTIYYLFACFEADSTLFKRRQPFENLKPWQ